MSTITLTLNAPQIKKAVKSDTYITGLMDKSADMVKNAAAAYNEQAGDETYHEEKLYRTMRESLSKFEASIYDFVGMGETNAKITDDLTSASTSFTITIIVGNRFFTNNNDAKMLATLAEEYIINMMLYYWWQAIKPSLAKDYFEHSQEALAFVRKALTKTPPVIGSASYNDVNGTVDDYSEAQNVYIASLPSEPNDVLDWSEGDYPSYTGKVFRTAFPEVIVNAWNSYGNVKIKGGYTNMIVAYTDDFVYRFDPEIHVSQNGGLTQQDIDAIQLGIEEESIGYLVFINRNNSQDTGNPVQIYSTVQ